MDPKLLAVKYSLTGPGTPVSSPVDATSKFEKVIGQIFGTLTIIAVIYFIFQIIFAGYAFISSQGDDKNMETARKRLTEGVLGLAIVVLAIGLGSLLAKLAGLSNPLDVESMFKSMGL